jgi:hypothetical protein
MKPKLKPTETKRLKVMCDMLLSTYAFKLNVRRYSLGACERVPLERRMVGGAG